MGIAAAAFQFLCSNDISQIPGSTKRVHTSDSTKSSTTPASKESTREPAPAAECHRVESCVPGYRERDEGVMLGPPSETRRAGRSYGIDFALNSKRGPVVSASQVLAPPSFR